MTKLREDQTILYGIGAQKAGTTWLFNQLAKHTQVHLPMPKELHYWDTIRGPANPIFLVRADIRFNKLNRLKGIPAAISARMDPKERSHQDELRAHQKLLKSNLFDTGVYRDFLSQDSKTAKVVGDITPGYALLSEKTYAEMAALHTQTKFIFILRDPIQRLVSGLKQSLRQYKSAGVINTEQLDQLAYDAVGLGNTHHTFAKSDYATTIQRLENAVPADNILYLFFETLFEQSSIDQITDFLGVDRMQAGFEKVYSSAQPDLGISDDAAKHARDALAHVYEMASARFGDAVPDSWQLLGKR